MTMFKSQFENQLVNCQVHLVSKHPQKDLASALLEDINIQTWKYSRARADEGGLHGFFDRGTLHSVGWVPAFLSLFGEVAFLCETHVKLMCHFKVKGVVDLFCITCEMC